MSLFKTFTQGGQVTLHNIRMLKQVLRVTMMSCLMMSLFFFGWRLFEETRPYQWRYLQCQMLANFKSTFENGKTPQNLWQIPMPQGHTIEVTPKAFLNSPFFKSHIETLKKRLWINGVYSFCLFLGLFGSLCGFWMWRGYAKKEKEILKGSQLVSVKELNKAISKKTQKSEFSLAGVTFPKDFEVQHTLMTGTTGSGKTNCFHELLPQIRALGGRAIIFDTTGEFVERYYDDTTDVILNPFDSRSQHWSLWKDCTQEYQFDNFATALIPDGRGDLFWSHSARTLFSVMAKTMMSLEEKETPQALVDYLLSVPLKKLHEVLEHTEAASLVDPASDKTAQSIRAHLSSYLKVFKYLHEDADFSLRDWVMQKNKQGWILISCSPEQRETLRPLMTAWFGMAISQLMMCGESSSRRLWFILDELASLNKLEALPKALAEVRKFGGCLVAGLQNTSQLQERYEYAGARTILSLFNTKITFRIGDVETAKSFSMAYGEHEVKEHSEGVSYGAHEMRDGVSLNEQNKNKVILSVSDFMSLNNLEGYLKLPGSYPLTKLTFTYHPKPEETD